MRSSTPLDLAGHCHNCRLNLAICLCAALPRVVTRTEVLIIRHAAELRLTSNTARFAALALPNSRIVEYAGRHHFDEAVLEEAGSVLLFNASGSARERDFDPPPRRLVVLDGSFRQARRMYKRIERLRTMPELCLAPPAIAPIRLRQPPHADGMSTLEAIAHALARLEGPEVAEPLHALHAELVRRVDELRGRHRS
jgi:DTW domain-containing protein YfiP